jgi:hypothetical protein
LTMVLYTRNLIPKIPARILGKHCQVMFLRTFGKPKAPNSFFVTNLDYGVNEGL